VGRTSFLNDLLSGTDDAASPWGVAAMPSSGWIAAVLFDDLFDGIDGIAGLGATTVISGWVAAAALDDLLGGVGDGVVSSWKATVLASSFSTFIGGIVDGVDSVVVLQWFPSFCKFAVRQLCVRNAVVKDEKRVVCRSL